MKFMKLGSRPDTFYTTEALRSVSSEVSSDLIIQIKGTRYLLHKFPLLSKCLHLQKLCSETSHQSPNLQIIQLTDFPVGPDSFELCAKFCYGITITLSPHNLVSARCAAEYLQMTEDLEKGNLISKLEIFFNSCILTGWKDIIVTLHSTRAVPSWSEDLDITSKCVEAIASKISANPKKVSLSHSHSRRARDGITCNGLANWWAHDLAELGIDLYWRVMIGVKSGGRVKPDVISDALRVYASRWLLLESSEVDSSKHRLLLESIISLLPVEKGAVSCDFLLKLLKAANVVRASESSKKELVTRVGIQLEEARVGDLLVLGSGCDGVDIVLDILEEFKMKGRSPKTSPRRNKEGFERRRSRSDENVLDLEFRESRRSSSASHGSKLKVAKVVDGYLKEIAKDEGLSLGKFIDVAQGVPEFARVDHDDLYHAIDIYLKVHPELNKSERKRLCKILDCKKLSMEACMHAAQNEKLPLRVVVQVLFFEQARAAMESGKTGELPSNIKALLQKTPSKSRTEDQWSSVSGLKSPKSNISTLKMKLDEDRDLDENFEKSSKLIPSRRKRIFSKFWPVYRSAK